MERIRKYGLLFILTALLLCFSGCSNENASSGAASLEQSRAAAMIIPMDELTAEPRFYDWNQDGTAMQLIALKSSAGDVHLAYNTCQSCAGSPYAYFEYQNGVLVCQNCMNRFGLDSVGKSVGGCNPMPVTGYRLDEDQVIIPADALTKAASAFRNWKVFR